MTDQPADRQPTAIEAAILSTIPGCRSTSTVAVRVTESDDVNGLQNSWTGPASVLAIRIQDHARRPDAELDDVQRAYIFDTAELKRENEKLRAERDRLLAFADWTASNTRPLTDIHTAALTAIDTPSTRAALADLAQIAAEMAAFVAADEAEGHQPHCEAATQGCCSCEDPAAPACSCGAEPVHQAGCDAT